VFLVTRCVLHHVFSLHTDYTRSKFYFSGFSLSLVLWAGSTWWTRPRRCWRPCAQASCSPHATPSPSSSGRKVPPGSLSGSAASSPLRGFVSLLPLLFLIIVSPYMHRSWAAGVTLLAWVRESGVATAGRVPGCGTCRVEAQGPALTGYVQTMASSCAQLRRSVTSPHPQTTSPFSRTGCETRGST
jgi:hypothetical protein